MCSKTCVKNVCFRSQFYKAFLQKLSLSRPRGPADDVFVLTMAHSLTGQGFRHITLPCPHGLPERDRRPGFFSSPACDLHLTLGNAPIFLFPHLPLRGNGTLTCLLEG